MEAHMSRHEFIIEKDGVKIRVIHGGVEHPESHIEIQTQNKSIRLQASVRSGVVDDEVSYYTIVGRTA